MQNPLIQAFEVLLPSLSVPSDSQPLHSVRIMFGPANGSMNRPVYVFGVLNGDMLDTKTLEHLYEFNRLVEKKGKVRHAK